MKLKNLAKATLLFWILVAACKKDLGTFVPIQPLLKKNFSYKVGSYWLYRDSVSGDLDSLWIYNKTTGIYEIRSKRFELQNVYFSESFQNKRGGGYMTLIDSNFGIHKEYDLLFNQYDVPVGGSKYPYIKGVVQLLTSTDTMRITEVYGFFESNAVKYPNVVCIECKGIKSDSAFWSKYYVSDSVGIIRVEEQKAGRYRLLKLENCNVLK